MRTISGPPTRAVWATPARVGCHEARSRRAERTMIVTNAAAAVTCAMTVPQAEPEIPQSNP